MRKMAGFSLYELLISCAILSVLTGMALPAYSTWRKDAAYKEVAQAFFGALREARQRAISSGLEHRVEFDLDVGRYRMTHGNRALNSTDSSWDQNVVRDWVSLSSGIIIKSLSDCTKSTGTDNIHMNPNGSANSRYICVMDENSQPRYRVGVPYSTTGKSVIKHWNSASNSWD